MKRFGFILLFTTSLAFSQSPQLPSDEDGNLIETANHGVTLRLISTEAHFKYMEADFERILEAMKVQNKVQIDDADCLYINIMNDQDDVTKLLRKITDDLLTVKELLRDSRGFLNTSR